MPEPWLILDPETSLTRYTHNGEVCPSPMRQQVDSFSNKLVMTGRISASRKQGEAGFRLWFSPRDRAALVKRIEFRPKGFLKLALEAEETRSGSVQMLFKEQR